MRELKCPLCNSKFLTVDDLISHMETHKAKNEKLSAENEVALVEVGVEGLREVTATVVSVTKGCTCDLCKKAAEKARFKPRYPRWHIVLRPDDGNYKDFHVWIAADKAYSRDPRTAGKGTQLGDYVVRLKKLGLKGATVDELMSGMLHKRFLFERIKIGRKQRETWIPKRLLSTVEETVKEGIDPVQSCLESIVSNVEPGRAYTLEEIKTLLKARGIDFPNDVIEKAVEKLIEKGRAFKLPTQPVKYFYEG